jgi:hypothetical protein
MTEILHSYFVIYGWLLNQHPHGVESLRNFSNPVVLLQGRKSRSNCFIKGFRCDINRVLDVANIPNRNLARSQHHEREDSIFRLLFATYKIKTKSRPLVIGLGLQRSIESHSEFVKMVEEI